MVCFAFFINRLLAPHKPNPEKLTSYECGEEPTGSAWLPFNSRFYVIALVFLLFDVEMVFIFPWAIVFGNHEMNNLDARWGWLALTEMFIFLGILILGLAYVWRKGDLDWIKPHPIVPATDIVIPKSLYEKLNAEQSGYKIREFTPVNSQTVPGVPPGTHGTPGTSGTSGTPPIKTPGFKPTFKKPANE
ncbi:MAG: dehydrogenase [Mucilaginibacter sp.]|nr:dehydrogenase [Mucilaginibacter sp.]